MGAWPFSVGDLMCLGAEYANLVCVWYLRKSARNLQITCSIDILNACIHIFPLFWAVYYMHALLFKRHTTTRTANRTHQTAPTAGMCPDRLCVSPHGACAR